MRRKRAGPLWPYCRTRVEEESTARVIWLNQRKIQGDGSRKKSWYAYHDFELTLIWWGFKGLTHAEPQRKYKETPWYACIDSIKGKSKEMGQGMREFMSNNNEAEKGRAILTLLPH
jgi:hypothetical protein